MDDVDEWLKKVTEKGKRQRAEITSFCESRGCDKEQMGMCGTMKFCCPAYREWCNKQIERWNSDILLK